LKGLSKIQRFDLAGQLKPKDVVHRHMSDGDYVLISQQPALDKASITAHRVRILQNDDTVRLHYTHCKPGSVDQEVHIHFPQSMQARSEAASMSMCTI
jgi:DNA-directed RNA polymerase I subunit RPA1